MNITADAIGKRFNRDWIFKNISLNIPSASALAITGPNGSGKSTLLQVLSSITVPTTGTVSFFQDTRKLDTDTVYRSISFVSPYQEIPEEMTLQELLDFHVQFKALHIKEAKVFAEYCGIVKGLNKEIRMYSSGMKQRVKLGLAFLSESACLLLDEPTNNLDKQGSDWYLNEIQKCLNKKTIVVASNIPEEYTFAGQVISLGTNA